MRNIEVGQGFEIRVINGKEVFVKQLSENAWLFDDICVVLCKDYKVTDEEISGFLGLKQDPYVPCKSVHEGFALCLYEVPGGYGGDNCPLDCFTDKSLIGEAQKAYEEYKVWAGI